MRYAFASRTPTAASDRARPAGQTLKPAPRPATLSNQAQLRRLQARLKVGAAIDPLEHEADAVAEKVMRMSEPARVSNVSPIRISRKCAGCEAEEQKTLSMKRAARADVDDVPPIVDDAMRSPAQPLDATTRGFFEPRFGYDFSGVRLRFDDNSASAARALQARAYTIGSDITFGAGEYAPTSNEGRRLLAHELAHVVQQGAAVSAPQTAAP